MARGIMLATLYAIATLAVSACAAARNYTDPAGPVDVFGGAAARPLDTGDRDSDVATRAAPLTPLPARSADTLKVVTFNIKFGEQIMSAVRLLTSNADLRDADVLLLEEVDADGAQLVAEHLGASSVYVPSAVHPVTGRDFGVAIVSRWPVTDPHKVLLPGRSALRHMRRSAAAATVATPLGAVRVYAVHLETPIGASDRDRRTQIRAIVADASAWPGALVVAGDFNGTDAADELAREGFTWLTRRIHDTAGPFDFDHIAVRGLCPAGNVPATRGPSAHGISDHRPVWAVIEPCPSVR